MPKAASDFRNFAFDSKRISTSGKDVGAKVYPKLYAIENLIRVVVHSVLTAQLGQNWWTLAAGPQLQSIGPLAFGPDSIIVRRSSDRCPR